MGMPRLWSFRTKAKQSVVFREKRLMDLVITKSIFPPSLIQFDFIPNLLILPYFLILPCGGGFKLEKAVKNCGRQHRSFFYAFISIPFLKVKRISSRLYTVAYSTRLYQSSSLNSVNGPSLFSSSARNRSVFSRFAIRSVMAVPTASSRSFILSKRSLPARHIFSGTPSGQGQCGHSRSRTAVSSPPLCSSPPEAESVPLPVPVHFSPPSNL